MMDNCIPLGISAYDCESDERFLVRNDVNIRKEAWRAIPKKCFSEDVLDLEVDEFAQSIRIKLWKSRQGRPITNPRAYIRTIAHTTAVDIVRRHKPSVSLSDTENDESELSTLLTTKNEGFQDPAYE